MAETYKIAAFWDAWTPQIATRVLRDAFALQRMARVNRCRLVIACDEILHDKLLAMGIEPSLEFVGANQTNVYLIKGTQMPSEVADRVEAGPDINIVSLEGTPPDNQGLVIETDPYAGVKFPQDWQRIPETMPLERPAPKGESDEPMWSPWL